jgi:starch synthase
VLNGIDMEEYNPEIDPLIEINYTSRSPGRKKKNKMLLQAQLGLEVDETIPMIGMIGRLADQKGLDLVERVLEKILATGVQLVILGKGDDKYVQMLRWAQWKFSGRVAACIEMNHKLAHQIYASSDLFLMPSKFEPCGLSQLIALRYGTLPIVRETGGLKDTVFNYNEYTGTGNGFSFAEYNADKMLDAVKRAVDLYREDSKTFTRLVRRAMNGQYGWDKSAQVYMDVYESLVDIEEDEE